jgi:high affinity Mn2+ porin
MHGRGADDVWMQWYRAADDDQEIPAPPQFGPVELHGQATYIRQFKPGFPAADSGGNSLSPEEANSYSLTGAHFFGARITETLEVYVNPEAASGVPFSELHGVAGFTNAESTLDQRQLPVSGQPGI